MINNNKSLFRKEVSLEQLLTFIALLLSIFVISSLAPSIGKYAPNLLLLLYYLLVPGYCVTLVIGEKYDFLQRFLFSIFVSISISLSLLAVNHIGGTFVIPLQVSLPVISIGIIMYSYFFHS